jgi:hypothetical protein
VALRAAPRATLFATRLTRPTKTGRTVIVFVVAAGFVVGSVITRLAIS